MADKLNLNDNGLRASKLLLDGGGYLTKQILLQKAVQGTFSTIDDFLADIHTKQKIKNLKGLVKSSQKDIMYPINRTPTNLDDWDITLVTLILKNCFSLSNYEEDLIKDIRSLRNSLYGHTTKVEMTDKDFVLNWSSISSALTRHSALLTDANHRQHIQDLIIAIPEATLSAEKTIVTLKQWYEWGIEVEQKMENIREEQNNRLDTFEKTATDRHMENLGKFQTLESSLQSTETDISLILKLLQRENREEKQQIDNARINLEAHKQDLQKMNITASTIMTKETTDKLKQNKIVVLKGIPGAGKTHLAKNIMINFLSLYSDIKPLIIRKPNIIETVLDSNDSHILLVDDFAGKVAFDAIENKDWLKYVENFVNQIKIRELYVIITIRKSIFGHIDSDYMSFLFEKDNVLDIDEYFTSDAKSNLIQVYAKFDSIDISKDQIDNIVPKKCIGVGFPLLCKMMKGQNVEKFFERPIQCLVTEIKRIEKLHPTEYLALFMTLICENKLSRNGLSTEQTECFKTLQSYYGSSHIDLSLLYRAADSLDKTYISFNETESHYEFLHEAVAHSTCLAALKVMPLILINHCPIDTLVGNLNLVWENRDTRESEPGQNCFEIGKSHKNLLVLKMLKIMSSEKYNEHSKTIANASMWTDKHFIDEAMVLFKIDQFYRQDSDGKSLLTYFASFGNVIAVETIIDNSLSFEETSIKSDAFQNALIEACLANKYECADYLRLKCLNITKDVVFAIVKGGNKQLLEDIASHFGVDKIVQITENDTGKTILHVASETGNVDIVLYICKSWPSLINKLDENGAKAMHSAAAKGKTECLKHILKYEVNECNVTDKGETLLHISSKFGYIETIEFICKAYPDMVKIVDEEKNTPLHSLAFNGNTECLQYLIKNQIDPTQKNKYGVSVAFKAAECGNNGILNFMLESHKEVLHDKDTRTGITLLHMLAYHNNMESFKLLIKEGVNPDVRTNEGETILHFAASPKIKTTFVQHICKEYKGMVLLTDNLKYNVIHHAAANGSSECLKLLIKEGIDPRVRTADGSTILHKAAYSGNVSTVMYICETYPDLKHAIDNSKRNATDLAAACGSRECLHYLIEQKINPRNRTPDGSTILHKASHSGNLSTLRYICEKLPDLKHETDNFSRNAIHLVAEKGTVECLKFLIDQEINPSEKNKHGSSILHRAAFNGNFGVLVYICEKFQDMNLDTDNFKRNAAHKTAEKGTVECLKFLLEQGINPSDKAVDGSTIFHRAARYNNIKVLRYIYDVYPELINGTDNNERNAAQLAERYGAEKCLKFLKQQGINP